MNKYNYTSVDRIFAKFSRDLRGTDLHETDVIEWIGEAMGFMQISEIQEEAVAFIEVKNHKAEIPNNFQAVIQIARNNKWIKNKGTCINDITQDIIVDEIVTPTCSDCSSGVGVITDCKGNVIYDDRDVSYRAHFDLQWEYNLWRDSKYYVNHYTPIRLANHSFFNSIVCRENDQAIYAGCTDEYTIIEGYPSRQLRFNFREGQIALAYLRSRIDPENGYPLIPDNIEHITAITYYVKWKMAERLRWDGRQGFAQEAQDAEQKWLKYIRQANNKTKMPTGVDQYQNIMEQSMYMIPRFKKYYGFFGSLGREENKAFNNSNYGR